MKAVVFRRPGADPAGPSRRPGVTLLEVLVAIFITGIGLLALINLFSLAVLNMAQRVNDDRMGKIVLQTDALVAAADVLLPATGDFLAASLNQGSADPQAAGELRVGYEKLGDLAADLEARLKDIAPIVQDPVARKQLRIALDAIERIQAATAIMEELLTLLETGNVEP